MCSRNLAKVNTGHEKKNQSCAEQTCAIKADVEILVTQSGNDPCGERQQKSKIPTVLQQPYIHKDHWCIWVILLLPNVESYNSVEM